MALEATVRTRRVLVRLRRPCLPHLGQGAFLGAHRTGITIGVGASVPMVCISGVEVVITLIHRDAGPIFQEQNGLAPSLFWWRSARSVGNGESPLAGARPMPYKLEAQASESRIESRRQRGQIIKVREVRRAAWPCMIDEGKAFVA